ncbi:unnamed protein product [Brachionus calyciflorus]|uniref:Uncharacterized protein n=1 Tax=Brachionus calyciflorus TaxID=104777 RepID=A0A814QHX2_9BILA|nr:unnamed protein product [Brachionus calyciflorus]
MEKSLEEFLFSLWSWLHVLDNILIPSSLLNELETRQNLLLKRIIGLKKFTHISPLYETLKIESVRYEGREADLCPELSDNDDVDEAFDVFNPSEFQLDEIVTSWASEYDIPAEQIIRNANSLLGIRESVRGIQGRQAEAMRTRCKRYLPDVSVGDYAGLPIPDVERGLSEAPNLVCRIVDIDHEKSAIL